MILFYLTYLGTISAYKRQHKKINLDVLARTKMIAGVINMKPKLQHLLHPLHLWCRVDGHAGWFFRLYEKWLWQPLLRGLLSDGSMQSKEGV
jgi:hypothetical protein